MIPTLLQDVLVEEIKALFNGFLLKNVEDKLSEINVHSQYLPYKTNIDDEEHFPYIIVRMMNGEEDEEEAECKIVFVIGVYDESEDNQGFKDVLNIIEKIRQHIFKKQIFANQFICKYPLKWGVNEEDVSPFYFGGIESSWSIAKITMPDNDLV